jgi:hypothetical protein
MKRLSLLLVVFALAAYGGVIGNWSGSARAWNDSAFSTIKALMIAQGHSVLADGAMSAAALAGVNMFVVGEPSSTPGTSELTDLLNWVTAGGVLLLLADSGGSGQTGLNAIAAGLGSSLSWGGSASSSPALAGGVFATTGPPYNIVGMYLSTTQGTAVSGGTALTGDYIRWDLIGAGYIFGFADRSDHNLFDPSTTNVNGQLFLNLAAHEAGGVIPEPSTFFLLGTGLGLAALAVFRRRK